MSLAQVVYNISNDADFASQWRKDPEAALAGKGYQLSLEEFNFLSVGLLKSGHTEGHRINLSELISTRSSWKGG